MKMIFRMPSGGNRAGQAHEVADIMAVVLSARDGYMNRAITDGAIAKSKAERISEARSRKRATR